jgi:hypothetical protein
MPAVWGVKYTILGLQASQVTTHIVLAKTGGDRA